MHIQPLDKTGKFTLTACGIALAMILGAGIAIALEYGLL